MGPVTSWVCALVVKAALDTEARSEACAWLLDTHQRLLWQELGEPRTSQGGRSGGVLREGLLVATVKIWLFLAGLGSPSGV